MSFIETLKVILIGIVEGFTEWLPISSTGHMLLMDEIVHLDMTPEFKSLFMIVIQVGALLALIVMYFKRLNPFDPRKKPERRKATWQLWFKIAVATIPAAILGLLVDEWVDEHLSNGLVIGIMLITLGVAFIIFERKNKYKQGDITRLGQLDYMTAFYIGLFQMIAILPGTSRSGATILGALILGCARPVAVEFSFFLGIPMIAGNAFIKFIRYPLPLSSAEIMYLLIGLVVAFLVSIYSVKFFIGWIKKNSLEFFGYYRIILGAIILIWYILSNLIIK